MISARIWRQAMVGLFLLSFAPGSIYSNDWPQWRGPDRTAHVPAGVGVLKSLPDEREVVWEKKIGEGLASPVVAGGRLFYFDAQDGIETIHALDARTGEEIWKAPIDSTFQDRQGPAGPRNTPVVDGDRIYAVSCKGELQCLDTKDGKVRWRTNFTNDFGAVFIGERGNIPGAARHGNNGSPLVVGDRLYACVGGLDGAGVVCFDKYSGEVLWKSQNDQAAYAPPVLATVAGRQQLICFTVEGVIGLDPDNGKLFWRVPVTTAYGRHVAVPIVWQDYVVVSSHQAGLIGIRISKSESGFSAEEAWVSQEGAMNFASPVRIDGQLYGVGPNKNLVCVDIATGKLLWSEEGYFFTPGGKAFAAFIVFPQQRVLMLTDGGMLVLFEAKASGFTELDRLQASGLNWCFPAYSDGKLYVRDGLKGAGNLLCLDLESEAALTE